MRAGADEDGRQKIFQPKAKKARAHVRRLHALRRVHRRNGKGSIPRACDLGQAQGAKKRRVLLYDPA